MIIFGKNQSTKQSRKLVDSDHSVCCLLSTNLKTLSTHETISNYELHYVLIAWKSLKYHRAWFLWLDLFNSIYLFSQNHVNVIRGTLYIYDIYVHIYKQSGWAELAHFAYGDKIS